MGRSPCCDKVGLKKGPWTPEEDQALLAYIQEHGHGSWRSLPEKAGLQRCGKSCRLRWTNYLRPDIKRGKFSQQEEQTIIQLHALLGNRWSAIATHLPKRTDNEIKNYWNTHLKKRLIKMGIDPVTHKPKNETPLSSNIGQSKNAATLSHMAQWERARLEAETRLARESSKLRSRASCNWANSKEGTRDHDQLESPTYAVTSSKMMTSTTVILVHKKNDSSEKGVIREGEEAWKGLEQYSLSFTSGLHHDLPMSMEGTWSSTSDHHSVQPTTTSTSDTMEEGFSSLLLGDSMDQDFTDHCKESDENSGRGSDYDNQCEDNKIYWNNILDLVDSRSPSNSAMF